MTAQDKRYIELENICAIMVKCGSCGEPKSVPLTLERVPYYLVKCPGCGKAWLPANQNPDRNMVVTFADDLNNLKRLLSTLPFAVYIEVASEHAGDKKKESPESGPRAR